MPPAQQLGNMDGHAASITAMQAQQSRRVCSPCTLVPCSPCQHVGERAVARGLRCLSCTFYK